MNLGENISNFKNQLKDLSLYFSKDFQSPLLNKINYLTNDFNWLDLQELLREIKSLGAIFNEVENQALDFALDNDEVSLPSEYEKLNILILSIIDFIEESNKESTISEIITDLNRLPVREQMKLLTEQEYPLIEFLPYLSVLDSDIIKLIAYKLANQNLNNVHRLSQGFSHEVFLLSLAEYTHDEDIIMELFSAQNEKVEKILIKRFKNNSLKIKSPGLFSYWGQLSSVSQLQLIKSLNSLDEYLQIERFLVFHTNLDDGLIIWTHLLSSNLKDLILEHIDDNLAYLKILETKWPQFFKKKD